MVTVADEEVAVDEATDEFAEHFDRTRPPKVLITTCYKPSGIMYKFLAEMLQVCQDITSAFPCPRADVSCALRFGSRGPHGLIWYPCLGRQL